MECSCAGCPADERLLLGVISDPRQRTRDYRPDTAESSAHREPQVWYDMHQDLAPNAAPFCDVIVKPTWLKLCTLQRSAPVDQCTSIVECAVCSQWPRPRRKSRKETKHSRSCFVGGTQKEKCPIAKENFGAFPDLKDGLVWSTEIGNLIFLLFGLTQAGVLCSLYYISAVHFTLSPGIMGSLGGTTTCSPVLFIINQPA